MSDEQAPAWVQVMEARAEAREHHLLTEISKAISDSEARTAARLDDIRDNIRVNLVRAEAAHTRVDADRERLMNVEGRLSRGGPRSPEGLQ